MRTDNGSLGTGLSAFRSPLIWCWNKVTQRFIKRGNTVQINKLQCWQVITDLKNDVTCKNHMSMHMRNSEPCIKRNKRWLLNLSKNPPNNGIDVSVYCVGRCHQHLFILRVRFAILLPGKNQSEQLTESSIKFWRLPWPFLRFLRLKCLFSREWMPAPHGGGYF